jgi:hypothetical protein
VVLKSQEMLPVATALTPLGPDENAIRSSRRRHPLFDLGLGRVEMRFCVRTSEAELLDVLNGATGLPLTALLSTCGMAIMRSSPARVVETLPFPIQAAAPPLGLTRTVSHRPSQQLAPRSRRSSCPGLGLGPWRHVPSSCGRCRWRCHRVLWLMSSSRALWRLLLPQSRSAPGTPDGGSAD